MNRIFICALLCLSALWARNIDEIRYQGLSAISNVLADEIVNIKPGDSLDIAKVDKAVVALYSQG
ncbi:hypothetical protein, partial [Helicobacter typhlonius]